ncbi:unnamed protein product, partial [Effrenium voratum]
MGDLPPLRIESPGPKTEQEPSPSPSPGARKNWLLVRQLVASAVSELGKVDEEEHNIYESEPEPGTPKSPRSPRTRSPPESPVAKPEVPVAFDPVQLLQERMQEALEEIDRLCGERDDALQRLALVRRTSLRASFSSEPDPDEPLQTESQSKFPEEVTVTRLDPSSHWDSEGEASPAAQQKFCQLCESEREKARCAERQRLEEAAEWAKDREALEALEATAAELQVDLAEAMEEAEFARDARERLSLAETRMDILRQEKEEERSVTYRDSMQF